MSNRPISAFPLRELIEKLVKVDKGHSVLSYHRTEHPLSQWWYIVTVTGTMDRCSMVWHNWICPTGETSHPPYSLQKNKILRIWRAPIFEFRVINRYMFHLVEKSIGCTRSTHNPDLVYFLEFVFRRPMSVELKNPATCSVRRGLLIKVWSVSSMAKQSNRTVKAHELHWNSFLVLGYVTKSASIHTMTAMHVLERSTDLV